MFKNMQKKFEKSKINITFTENLIVLKIKKIIL